MKSKSNRIKEGKWLMRLRKKHKWHQWELARYLGTQQPNVCAMERGERNITENMWIRLGIVFKND